MKKTLLIIGVIFCFLTGQSQILTEGTPYSIKKQLNNKIEEKVLPSFDYKALIEEDKANLMKQAYRFAKIFPVNYTMENSGTMYIDQEGNKIWRLKIISKDAFSMALIFRNFELPKNAELYIYTPDKSYIFGAITSKNNKTDKILPTAHIPSDEIIVEYFEPKNAEINASFYISEVSHNYRDDNKSEWCEVNINCEEGADWQNLKHSVCRYDFSVGSYEYWCTGALVANTNNDDTPYFLTASHCISSQEMASTVTLYFNYESATCDGTTGPQTQTISNATLIANKNDGAGNLDFALLQISAVPPAEYQAYYAGWNTNDNFNPNVVTCIHHPAGDIKKITVHNAGNNPSVYPYSLGMGGITYDSHAHWYIWDWEVGTTEGGSSGSPLFDHNKRIIGDLSGGTANCDGGYDLYQRFSIAWDSYSVNNEQLKYWLDPAEINPTTFDGYYLFTYNSPQNLVAEVTGNSVELSWDAPSSKNITGFQLYRNEELLGSELPNSQLSYTDDNLENDDYTYCVKGIYEYGTSDCSNEETITINSANINIYDNRINVYPNPVNKIVSINNLQENSKIEIYTITGIKIYETNTSNNIINIDISNINSGAYIIKIISAKQISNKTLIIE